MMNKKGFVGEIIGGISITLILFIIWFVFLNPVIKYDKDCLKQTAIKVCNNNGYKFYYVDMVTNPRILCYETARSTDTVKLRFLPEELKECKK